MASGTYAPQPAWVGLDNDGNPISGALLYTYLAGTSTPATTYTDVGLTTANPNPVVLDSAGRATIILSPGASYKFILKTAAGVTVWSRDNISAVPASSSNLEVTGTAGEALTAGQTVYLSDGSNSLTAGSWYRTQATASYSSTIGPVGFATAAIANGAAGTIRLAGQMTALSSLVVGTTYWLSATAGAITATAPTNHRRKVGVADTTSSLILNVDPNVPDIDVSTCQGRVTLTSGTAYTTSDVTAATTIYFCPDQGNRVALFDGTWWSLRTFTELSIAIPNVANQAYDVWLYDNVGTLTLELLAWTSDTVRATDYTLQDGVKLKTGALTRRLLASVRTTSVAGQTEDSKTKRLVASAMPRRRKALFKQANTTGYADPVPGTYHQAGNDATHQLEVMVCVPEVVVEVRVTADVYSNTAATVVMVHVGEDSTSTPATESVAGQYQQQVASTGGQITASLVKAPAVGYHKYVWLEFTDNSGSTTWNTVAGGTRAPKNGLSGWIDA